MILVERITEAYEAQLKHEAGKNCGRPGCPKCRHGGPMKTKPAKKLEIVPNPEAVKAQYVEAYIQLKAAEKAVERLKPLVEKLLEKAKDWKDETDTAKLGMSEQTREFVMDLEGLKAKIDLRVLNPHLKTSTYRTIRVTFKAPQES